MSQEHPLKKWLDAHSHSQSWLARILGIKRQTVSRWIHGAANPRYETALAIEELTGGALSVRDLMDPRNVGRERAPLPTMTTVAQ